MNKGGGCERFTDFASRLARLRRGLPAVPLEGLPAVFLDGLSAVFLAEWGICGLVSRVSGGLF